MPSIKDKVLIGISQLPKQNNPKDLQILTGNDMHNIVHIVYALNRQGLVGFRLNKRRLQVPTNLYLTKQGQKYLERIERP
jgi:hypothetical protein